MNKTIGAALISIASFSMAIEIPLESITPVRVGYIDLQKVFDTYPEKSFAEGDLLKEVEKRKVELDRRQSLINLLRQQISADQTALDASKAGQAVRVPKNTVPAPKAAQAPEVSLSSPTTNTVSANTPYSTDDPLLGSASRATTSNPDASLKQAVPPVGSSNLLDQLSSSETASVLTAEAQASLQKRIDDNQRALGHEIAEFKSTRTQSLDDMKVLNKQKTYDIMSKIYALLQGVARDESVTVILDKANVLYGEETIDLTDKLIARLKE